MSETNPHSGFLGPSKTEIGNAGLKHFTMLEAATYIDLTETQVTPAGLRELQKALPKCVTSPAAPKDCSRTAEGAWQFVHSP